MTDLAERVEHLEWCIAEMTSEAPVLADLPAPLAPAHRRLLGLLITRSPRVVPINAIMAALYWDRSLDDWPESRWIISTHVSYTRKRLRQADVPGQIQAVAREGYRWVPGEVAA